MKMRHHTTWLMCQHLIFLLFFGCAEINNLVAEENSFNHNTIRKIQGTISEVRGMDYPSNGNELKLDIITRDKEFFTISVGPVWLFRRLNVNFREGEVITVVGSVVDPEDGIVIAQEIKRGSRRLVLRDNSGVPRWKQGSAFSLTPDADPTNRTSAMPSSGAYSY